jgi:hypothetical protein
MPDSNKPASGLLPFTNMKRKSMIMDVLIPFYIDGFYNNEITGHVLSVRDKDCNQWFEEYTQLFNDANPKRFFPICRLSDGEYTFLCGPQPPIKDNFIAQIASSIRFYLKKWSSKGALNAATSKGVSSGNYDKNEISVSKTNYLRNLGEISRSGILALHLTYAKTPFQERFHYALSRVFAQNNITITEQNYYPFYFVYAYFLTDAFTQFIRSKKVLIITGADENKTEKVRNYFAGLGVSSVHFYKISSNRSLYDNIDVSSLLPLDIDICFVAAGIGKPNIMVQLKPLSCTCIDVGFMFEVWANPELAYKRPWCARYYKMK